MVLVRGDYQGTSLMQQIPSQLKVFTRETFQHLVMFLSLQSSGKDIYYC